MNTSTLVLVIILPAALLLMAALIYAVTFARQRSVQYRIPPSRRPGPTDEALEGPLLERFQLWGFVLTLFLAIFLPFAYLHEPSREREASAKQLQISRENGKAIFEQFCARCHGLNATGGVVKRYVFPNQPGSKPQDYPAPDLTKIWERHQGESVAQVAWNTIQHGRPPTPMPTWGVRYGGPMNDDQVTNLVNWLLSIQSDGKQRNPLKFAGLGSILEPVTGVPAS